MSHMPSIARICLRPATALLMLGGAVAAQGLEGAKGPKASSSTGANPNCGGSQDCEKKREPGIEALIGKPTASISGSSGMAGYGIEVPQGMPGVSDRSALAGNFGLGLTRLLTLPVNESTLTVQGVAKGSGFTSNTEKNGVYSRVTTYEQSAYGSEPQNHDSVALEGQGIIGVGNMRGRAWGSDTPCLVSVGADGYCIANEAEIYNNGASEPLLNAPDDKFAYHAVSGGPKPATGAFVISGGDGQFYDGYVADRSRLVTNFLSLRDVSDPLKPFEVAALSKDGFLTVQGLRVAATGAATLPFNTPASSSAPCTPGQVSVDLNYRYTCVSGDGLHHGTWHRESNGSAW